MKAFGICIYIIKYHLS